MLHTM